jgi:hypothetical protein
VWWSVRPATRTLHHTKKTMSRACGAASHGNNAFPSEEWEVKPREVSMLNSAV